MFQIESFLVSDNCLSMITKKKRSFSRFISCIDSLTQLSRFFFLLLILLLVTGIIIKKTKYGIIIYFLMQTSFLYNADILVILYCFLGIWYCYDLTTKMLLLLDSISIYFFTIIQKKNEKNTPIVVLSSLLWWKELIDRIIPSFTCSVILFLLLWLRQQTNNRNNTTIPLSFPSILLLGFVADSIFIIFRYLCNTIIRGKIPCTRRISRIKKESNNVMITPKTRTYFQSIRNYNIFCLFCIVVIGLTIMYMLQPRFNYHYWIINLQRSVSIISFVAMYILLFTLLVQIPTDHQFVNENSNNKKYDNDEEKMYSNMIQQQQQQLYWYNQLVNYIVWVMPIIIVLCFGELVIIPKGLVSTADFYLSSVSSSSFSFVWTLPTLFVFCAPICIKLLVWYYELYQTRCYNNNKSLIPYFFFPKICHWITRYNIVYMIQFMIHISILYSCYDSVWHLRSTWDQSRIFHPIWKIILYASFTI